MESIAPLINFFKYILTGIIMYGCFIVVERIRPVEKHQPLKDIWFNLQWYVLYSVVAISLQTLGMSKIIEFTQNRLNAPFIEIPTPSNWWQYAFFALLYFLAVDFFYYWFHRWQHKTAFLWEQHKFHHSERSLNVTSSRRVHWLEDPFILFFLGIPMGVLFNFSSLAIGILAFIEILWLQFIHMNLRLELGWFSRVVTAPQYHRIHHSFQDEHIDKNFSAFFPIWDIVFGTYYHPRKNEFPQTGLHTGETYNNLWTASVSPFQAWRDRHYFRIWLKKMRIVK
ncbi:MAG: sterol desaturase family protein [Cyanobacteria bacterium P01_G01_bin.19]